jgi:hypothetical protein
MVELIVERKRRKLSLRKWQHEARGGEPSAVSAEFGGCMDDTITLKRVARGVSGTQRRHQKLNQIVDGDEIGRHYVNCRSL